MHKNFVFRVFRRPSSKFSDCFLLFGKTASNVVRFVAKKKIVVDSSPEPEVFESEPEKFESKPKQEPRKFEPTPEFEPKNSESKPKLEENPKMSSPPSISDNNKRV